MGAGRGDGGKDAGNPRGPELANINKACWPKVSFVRDIMDSADAPWPTYTGKRRNVPSSSLKMEANCLALYQECLFDEGLLLEVVQVNQNAGAPSTGAPLSYKWKVFKRWCTERDDNPFQCNVNVILCFLHSLQQKDHSTSTLKV